MWSQVHLLQKDGLIRSMGWGEIIPNHFDDGDLGDSKMSLKHICLIIGIFPLASLYGCPKHQPPPSEISCPTPHSLQTDLTLKGEVDARIARIPIGRLLGEYTRVAQWLKDLAKNKNLSDAIADEVREYTCCKAGVPRGTERIDCPWKLKGERWEPPPLTPSAIKDREFVGHIKALSDEKKSLTIIKAAAMLRTEFRQGNLSYADDLSKFLLQIDPRSGHAFYFTGEVKRWKGKRDESHTDFFRYLDIEARLPEKERGGDKEAEVCYERPGGYCMQRTAWICHLLANDFYEKGVQENDEDKKRDVFRIARNYVKCVREKFPNGFSGPLQHIPTAELERKLQKALR